MRSSLFLLSVILFLQATLAAEWQVLAPNVMTVAIGCSATDENTVFVSGGDDGTGAAILKSTDGGSTWSSLSRDLQMMYLSIDVAADSNHGVAGALGFWKQTAVGSYTHDGNTFEGLPYVPLFSASQSVSAKGENLYLVGFWLSTRTSEPQDGIIASPDGGKTLEYRPWSGIGARYGAFPTNTSWYITGGTWPTMEKRTFDLSSPFALNRRVSLFRNDVGGMTFKVHDNIPTTNKAGYIGVIQKSTDGGKTYQTVFNDTGRMYLNGISCVDDVTCWVVGEGDEGAWILNSRDGGKTWQEQTFLSGMSLLDVKMIDHNEGWAVGGEFLSNTFNALFVHTTDGGKTWTKGNSIANAYPNALTVVNSNRAYATAFLRNGLSSILGYF